MQEIDVDLETSSNPVDRLKRVDRELRPPQVRPGRPNTGQVLLPDLETVSIRQRGQNHVEDENLGGPSEPAPRNLLPDFDAAASNGNIPEIEDFCFMCVRGCNAQVVHLNSLDI